MPVFTALYENHSRVSNRKIQVGFDGVPPLTGKHKIMYAYQVVYGLFTPSCMGGVIFIWRSKICMTKYQLILTL